MRHILLCASLLAVSAPALAEQIPGTSFGHGNWRGAAYTSDATGAFSHCAISAPYVSGDELLFSVNSDATVTVGVASASITPGVGESFPVRLHVDRMQPITGTAIVQIPGMASLRVPDLDLALTAFRRGKLLKIESPFGWSSYDLSGTLRALDLATECAIVQLEEEERRSRQPPPVAAAPVMSQPAAASPTPAAVDRTMLFQVATSLIADLGLRDFRYLSEAEGNEILPNQTAVFWTSDSQDLLGIVTVLPLAGGDLRSTDGSDISFLSGLCEGEFASTSTQVSQSELPMRQISAICVEPEGQHESSVTKILAGDSMLYTVLVFGSGAQGSAAPMKPTAEHYLRAASFYRN